MWEMDDPTPGDKSFFIRGPIDLEVDYDDVDHKAVLAWARKIVAALNASQIENYG